MKKKKTILALIILTTFSIWGINKWRTSSSADMPNAVWVQASAVKETNLPLETHIVGTLVARSVEITPEVAGHVDEIFFKDGAMVKQGDVLIQLDDAVFKAQHQSAKAQLKYSENDLKRKVFLGKQGAIAQQAIDQADADFKEKKALAKERKVMLNKMKLLAPFDGVVGKGKINLGDYVTVGQSLVTLTDTKHLRIEYTIPEKYFALVKAGQEVKVTSTAYPGKAFSGKVSFISPTINPDNRSISLYAEIANEDNLLAPGMFVNATQLLGNEERALMIPAKSLVPILDGEQVYKIVDGKAYSVTVIIGKREQDKVQVIEGLSPGDKVITDGQLKIKNGMPVKIKTETLA